MARASSGQTSMHSVQPSMQRDSSTVTGTSTRLCTRDMGFSWGWGVGWSLRGLVRGGTSWVDAVQCAAHRDAVAAETDELQVDRAAVGEMGEAFEHQQRRDARGGEDGGRAGVGVDRLDGDLGLTEPLSGDPFEQDEDVVAGEVLGEQRLPEVAGDVGEVERQRQPVDAPDPLDVDDRLPRRAAEPGGDLAGRRDEPGRADLVLDLA